MVELGQKHTQRLVQKDQPHGGANNKHGQGREYEANDTFSRVVTICRGGVDMGIGVMDEVEFPHPGDLVLNPVCEPGAYEIE